MQALGYCPDFVLAHMRPNLKVCSKKSSPAFSKSGNVVKTQNLKRRGIRVVTNAGGLNPSACAAAVRLLAKKEGVDVKVASVHGDDLSACDVSALGVP